MMVDGRKPGEILDELRISRATFGSHRGRIMLKTGCKTDAQLGAWATLQRFAAP